jgi:hypothetical protein
MNANAIAKNYACLTPEERFRLILAAGGRGDAAEQDRLRQAAPPITLSASDYSPWSRAFDELALAVFLEILEETAKHHDAFERWREAEEVGSRELDTEEGLDEDDQERGAVAAPDLEENPDEPVCADASPVAKAEDRSLPTRTLDLYLAQGFVLKTKAAGWKRFCERLSVPPFVLWHILPGFERVQRALELLEDNEFRPGPAFEPEGMLRWLRKIRPKGQPKPSLADLMSPERAAEDLDTVFRQRVAWWGG